MWVVTAGFTSALREAESGCGSPWVETAESWWESISSNWWWWWICQKAGPSASHEAVAVDLGSEPSPALLTLSRGKR